MQQKKKRKIYKIKFYLKTSNNTKITKIKILLKNILEPLKERQKVE